MANINKIKLSGTTYNIQDLNATKTVELTQAQYDALSVKDPNTFYIITDAQGVDLSQYYTSAQTESAITQAVSGKQDTLISGTNIKTINNESLLGSGNIVIQGGGGTVSSAITSGDTNAVAGGAVYDKFDEVEQVTARALNSLAEADEVAARALIDLNSSISGKADTSAVTAIQDSLSGYVATSAVTTAVTSGSTSVITSGGVYEQMGGLKLIKLTQSAYDALSPDYDSNTLYVIVN